LAGHTLPLAISLNPNVGETTRKQKPCSHFGSIDPSCDRNISEQVNRHSAVAENLKVVFFFGDVSEPMALVHITSIIVGEIKCLTQQQAQCVRTFKQIRNISLTDAMHGTDDPVGLQQLIQAFQQDPTTMTFAVYQHAQSGATIVFPSDSNPTQTVSGCAANLSGGVVSVTVEPKHYASDLDVQSLTVNLTAAGGRLLLTPGSSIRAGPIFFPDHVSTASSFEENLL
jgi:delta 1-pyrroline-5-carboxylate dehydrogenase